MYKNNINNHTGNLKSTTPAIILLGATAIGKTRISLEIAAQFSCEIISVDSMQVYRYMDIGTAKATEKEQKEIPHHLIDIVYPDEDYNIARFMDDAASSLETVRATGNIPLLTGGSGLYLKALLNGLFETDKINPELRKNLKNELAEKGRDYLFHKLGQCDPISAARIHLNDTHRLLRALEIFQSTTIPWSQHLSCQTRQPLLQNTLQIGLTCDRNVLYNRINQRVQEMLASGLLNEVKKLLEMGYLSNLKSMQAIGYRHMVNFLNGQWSWQRCLELLARDTRRYAKRQDTWFRRDQAIRWFEPSQQQEIMATIKRYLTRINRNDELQ